MTYLPLKSLHPESSLIQSKLDYFSRLSNEDLILSLQAGQRVSLKARPDGTVLDGHHRIAILRLSGVDVDILPREIISKG
jgi:ParB-like chromosome segregation protein Spo0J